MQFYAILITYNLHIFETIEQHKHIYKQSIYTFYSNLFTNLDYIT